MVEDVDDHHTGVQQTVEINKTDDESNSLLMLQQLSINKV